MLRLPDGAKDTELKMLEQSRDSLVRDATADRPLALAIGGMLAMAAANGIDRFVYTPILPVMMEQLGLSASQAGGIASANFLGYLMGALFAARRNLRGSRRGWMIGSLLVSALCTGAMGLVTTMPAFLTLRCIGGFAGAIAVVISIALVVDRLAAGGRQYLAPVHFGGVGVGIVVSAIIVSSIPPMMPGWRMLWIAAAAASLCAAVAAGWLVVGQHIAQMPAANVAPEPIGGRFWQLIAANTLGAFGYVITGTFIVALVRASPVLQPVEGWVWVLFGLSCAPSVAVWNALGSRIGPFHAFAVVCLVEAVGVISSVLWDNPAGILVAALLVGSSFMALTALGMLGARQLTRGDVRRPVALMTAGFGVGQMAGPAFAGYVRDLTGTFVIPSLCAAIGLVIASALAYRCGRPNARAVAIAEAGR